MQGCKHCVLSLPGFCYLDLKQEAAVRNDCKSYKCLWILKPQIVDIDYFAKGGERSFVF